MIILALSDEKVPVLHGESLVTRFADVDLIVSCGDLPADYLEYIVTLLNVPLLYVPGNHDADDFRVRGGVCVDDHVFRTNGLLVAGLGGSRRYKTPGRHQYNEAQMVWRIARLVPKLLFNRLVFRRRLDLLVAHSPPFGIHDGQDLAHTGFKSVRQFIRLFKPAWMLHGHTHLIRNIETTVSELLGSKIVNVYPYRILEIPEQACTG